MRFTKLRMQNFGPYADETVDFTDFAATPLFLISGNTGAGKSTIFDAMLYALYGSDGKASTGDNGRVATSLRSNFADPKADTVVELEFNHQDKDYLVHRAIRVKRDGDLAPRDPELTVTAADGTVSVLTKQREVNAALLELLHLDKAQFRQIVLLPQGDFRRFLDADSGEREELLRNLFGTGMYARWQAAIHTHLSTLRQQMGSDKDRMEEIITSFTLADGQELADGEISAKLAQMQTFQEAGEQALTVHTEALKDARKQQKQASIALQAGQTLAQAFAQNAKLQAEAKQLAAEAGTQQKREARIKQLEWAQSLSGEYEQLQQTRKRANVAVSDYDITKQRLAAAEAQKQTFATTVQTLTDKQDAVQAATREAEQMTATIAQLQALHDATQQAELTQARAKQEAEQLAKVTASVDVTQNELASANAALTNGSLDTLQATVHQQEMTLVRLQNLVASYHDANQSVQTAEAQNRDAQTELSVAQAAADAGTTEHKTVKLAFYRSQAAILAAELGEGEACPVCGSTDHPHLAQTDATTTTKAKFDASARRLERLQGELMKKQASAETASTQLKQQQDELASATAALLAAVTAADTFTTATGGDIDAALTMVQRAGSELATNQQQLASKTRERTQLTQKRDRLQNDLPQLQSQLTNRREQQATADAEAARMTEHVATLRANLGDSADVDVATLTAKQATLQTRIEQFNQQFTDATQQLTQATNSAARLAGQVAEQQQQLQTVQTAVATLTTEFASKVSDQYPAADAETSYAQDLTQIGQLPGLRQAVNDYAARRATNQQMLTENAPKIAGQEQPDLDHLQVEAARQETAVNDLTQQLGGEEHQVQQNAAVITKLAQRLAKWQSTEQNVRDLATLEQAFNGNNPRKLGLERYVLGSYFDRVLTVGSQRLHKLTRGRYSFVLNTDVKVKRANRTGLEIDVYDDEVGGTRSVHTLSGGESFIAALCLALALGEVIQEESGGVAIDALFIDEGFGSLDAASLELAMEALESIEGHNRMIGIISHVETLKAGIPDQLQVIPDGTGRSRLRTVHKNG